MRLAIINTGGTISSVGAPLAPMTASEFAGATERLLGPILREQYPGLTLEYITDLVFPGTGLGTLDSTDLQPLDWCVIARRILQDYQDFDGWVVLHGTDSMAYSGSALPFLLNAFDREGVRTASLSKPVILTGSQTPLFRQDHPESPLSFHFDTDAYQNVCAAVAFAHQQIPEVSVAFRGRLWRGSRVLKVNADQDYAFSSPNYPPLATSGIDIEVSDSRLEPGPADPAVSLDAPQVCARMLDRLGHIESQISDSVVFPFVAFPAAYGNSQQKDGPVVAQLLRAVLDTGVEGIVLESYGAGNFPSGASKADPTGPVEPVLTKAVSEGVILLNCTQVLEGTVDSNIYAAGAWLARTGAISGGDMTPTCGFSKATVLLAERGWGGNDWDEGAVPRLLSASLVGERAITNRLDVATRPVLRVGQRISALDGSAALTLDAKRGLELVDARGVSLWSLALPQGLSQATSVHLTRSGLYMRDRAGATAQVLTAPHGQTVGSLALRGSAASQNLRLVLLTPTGKTLEEPYSQQSLPPH